MAEKANDIRLIQMNKYIRPVIKEDRMKDWVLNGQYNSFYAYIIDRYNGSPTNSSIINSYIDLTYGKGLQNLNSNLVDWVKFQRMLSETELRKVISDFVLFGEASMQVIPANGSNKLPTIYQLPKENTAPQKVNDENQIEGYYYSEDWKKAQQEPPDYFPILTEPTKKTSCVVIRPYKAGKKYFSDPDYLAGMPYAEMEEEIANYYVSHIMNGLSFGYIISIPNGNSYTEEEKDKFEKQIRARLTGSSNAGQFIVNYNGADAEITVTALEVNDAHKQWEFLTLEARQQLLTSHRVVSPSLVGVIPSTGFSSVADEMDKSEEQLMKRVISPKQNHITDVLEQTAAIYGLNLKLRFAPLTEPVSIAEKVSESISFSEGIHPVFNLIQLGDSEDLNNYDIIDECEVDYNENIEFASTGTARPNAKSEQDSENVLIRYRYVGNPSPEREFCKQMMKANKIYRKEDIIQMGNKTVNPGFGMSPNPNKPYSIWLYKGGGLMSKEYPHGTCKHKWNRVIYLKKGVSVDVKSPLAELISTSKARQKGFKVPTNDNKVSIAPHNM